MIEKEIWKDIKGYEGLYKVSNLGRIKNIIQLTLDGQVIKKWKNVSQVEKELGIFSTNIRSCCRGVIKTCGGYIWKYE